jgi:hypothetical protein
LRSPYEGTLLFLIRASLDRAKIVGTTTAMIDKIALSESFLEVLTRLGLETSLWLRLLAVACAWVFGRNTAIYIIVSFASDNILCINFPSFR